MFSLSRTKVVWYINSTKNQPTVTQQTSNSTGNAPEQDKEMQPSCNKLIKDTDSDTPSDSWTDTDHKQLPKTTLVRHNTMKTLGKLSHTHHESIAIYERYCTECDKALYALHTQQDIRKRDKLLGLERFFYVSKGKTGQMRIFKYFRQQDRTARRKELEPSDPSS